MSVDLETLRLHVGPGPSDDVLEALLAAALEAIDGRYGPTTEDVREYLRPFGQWVRLGRRAEAVVSVLEGDTLLADGSGDGDTDYELWPGGRYLRRLCDDLPITWNGWVDVTYTPLSDEAERDRVTVALVKLDLDHSPGLTGVTVGPWSEQYDRSEDGYRRTRDMLLASIRPTTVGTW